MGYGFRKLIPLTVVSHNGHGNGHTNGRANGNGHANGTNGNGLPYCFGMYIGDSICLGCESLTGEYLGMRNPVDRLCMQQTQRLDESLQRLRESRGGYRISM